MNIKEKLKRHIIDKSKPEWNIKKLNWDDELVEVPDSMDGELLLEEHTEDGKVKGWIAIAVDDFEKKIDRRDNPSKRKDELSELPKFKDRNRRDLSPIEYEEEIRCKKYFDKWRAEGIDI